MAHYDELKKQAHNNLLSSDEKVGHELNLKVSAYWPFVHISTMPHGEIKLCCRGQPQRWHK